MDHGAIEFFCTNDSAKLHHFRWQLVHCKVHHVFLGSFELREQIHGVILPNSGAEKAEAATLEILQDSVDV